VACTFLRYHGLPTHGKFFNSKGEKPMTAFTDFGENKIADALRGQPLGAPATWYFALVTSASTDAAAGAEVTGNGYVRPSLAATLDNISGTQGAGTTVASSGSGGTVSNNVAINFATPTGAGWGTVVGMLWYDAVSGGNAWIYTPLTANKTINAGDTVSLPAGCASLQVDN
jgi:hypothetical protein